MLTAGSKLSLPGEGSVMASNTEPTSTIGVQELRSLETSILKALCLTINTAGSELKYKILDSLSDDDFYFPVTKAVFRTLSEMHLRGDYVISANMEEELQEAGVELSSDFSMEVLFGGSLPALSELNQWVVRLKERSRTGMIPTVKPPAPAAGSGRAPDSTPNAHPTVVRSVAEVKQRIAEEARKSSPAVRPASKLAQSSPAVAAPRPAPPPSDPPRSKPAIASKPAPSREASSPSTPSTQAKRPQKAVLSSEGDDWASYMDDLASQQGKTFDIGFARLDEGLGGLGPGLMLLVDENKERLFSFLKQVTDQFASGSTMRCLYVASQLPKAALRVRTLSRLAAVPTRDIEKGRLKKDSPEWKRIDAEGRRASDWLKKVFVYEVEDEIEVGLVRELTKKLLESTGDSTCLVVVDALERITKRGGTASVVASQLKSVADSMDVLILAATTDPTLLSSRDADYAAVFRESKDGSVELEVLQSGRENSTIVSFRYESDVCRFTET